MTIVRLPVAGFRPVGAMLRDWRLHRRRTQRDLACAAVMSCRQLSALEAGTSLAGRDILLRLMEVMEIPLRDRNALLTAGGYVPAFPWRLPRDPDGAGVRGMIDQMLGRQMPCPALALNRHWDIYANNDAAGAMIAGADPALLGATANWARLSLHPAGLAPRIGNLRQWRDHLLTRLRRNFEMTGDTVLADLLEEIGDYPLPPETADNGPVDDAMALPLQLMTLNGLTAFMVATTTFPTATDVTLAELTIETFYPADVVLLAAGD